MAYNLTVFCADKNHQSLKYRFRNSVNKDLEIECFLRAQDPRQPFDLYHAEESKNLATRPMKTGAWSKIPKCLLGPFGGLVSAEIAWTAAVYNPAEFAEIPKFKSITQFGRAIVSRPIWHAA